ncbi:MAG: hypothetical protein ACE5IC_10185 [Candidatus Brocadiales bacterium]
MRGSKVSLIFVITFGVLLLALFGTLLPLLVGKVARTYREHKDLAKVHSSIHDSKVAKGLKEEGSKKVAQPPSPIVRETVPEHSQQGVEKDPLRQSFKPSPPSLARKREKKFVASDPKTILINKDDTVETALPGTKETEEDGSGLLPAIPEVAYVLPSIDEGLSKKGTEKNDNPTEKTFYTMLPRAVDLKKTSKGVFPVEIRLPQRKGKTLKPQISYWVGTDDTTEYADMQAGDGDVWKYEIPDLEWAKHRSQFLFYKIRIVNGEGDLMFEGQAERELIDSFDNDSFDNG